MTKLEWLKSKQRHEALTLVIDDPDAHKLLVAWTLYYPNCKDEELPENFAPIATLNQWCGVRVDYDRLSRLSGVPSRTTMEKFYRLRSAFLVFPDGTVSEHAMGIIGADLEVRLRKIANAQMKARDAK